MICKLCEKNKATSKHHIIPKNVVQHINPKSKIGDIVINLCDECHKQIHFAYLNHLVMSKKIDGYNRFNSVKYTIMKEYLKNKHRDILHEFYRYWKEFIDNTMKEFDEEMNGGSNDNKEE